jgi:CHAD domain-containing protein
MKVPAEVSWRLNDGVARADLEAALAPRFSVEWRDGPAAVTTCYDDADAALWHADCLLCESGAEMSMTRAGVPVGAAAWRGDARFWWDFPAGALRDALRPLVGVRAVFPVATHAVGESALTLVNEDGKIVVRATVVRSVVDGYPVHYLTLKPLRGYEAQSIDACRRIGHLLASKADLGMRAMLAGHRIAAFSACPTRVPAIPADMPSEQAVRIMAHGMLAAAQRHVYGVVGDIDTEFLHLFRVGLRKTRSLVSLMKKTLPEATAARLRPRLAGMAARTSTLRDLDVYLLAQHGYVASLPVDFEAGMAELTAQVAARRAQAHTEVAAYFSSAAFRGDSDACLAALSLQPDLATPAASKPVLPAVKRQMLKRFAGLQAMCRLLDEDSADDDLHALRIECKKLRYLFEFFMDLLPKKRSARLLGDLKKLQGVLGDFNDLSVQIDFLNAFQDPARADMTKAVHGLTAILHMKKRIVRGRIFDALDGYFTENRAIEFALVFGTRHQKEAA